LLTSHSSCWCRITRPSTRPNQYRTGWF